MASITRGWLCSVSLLLVLLFCCGQSSDRRDRLSDMLKSSSMGNFGVYIQVPFCQTKCTYCNFHTGVVSAGRFAPYAEAVCREIREHARLLRAAGVEWNEKLAQTAAGNVVVDTVYIGGGTWSLRSLRTCYVLCARHLLARGKK